MLMGIESAATVARQGIEVDGIAAHTNLQLCRWGLELLSNWGLFSSF
jgi:hypothetical protein